jgi:hypothetical protein
VNSVSMWQSFSWKWKGCWCYYMMHPCSISRGCGLIFNSVWMEIKTWHTLLNICALGEGGELSRIRTSKHSSWTDFTHLNCAEWIIKALSAIGTKSDRRLAQTSPYYSCSIFCMSQWDYNLMVFFFKNLKFSQNQDTVSCFWKLITPKKLTKLNMKVCHIVNLMKSFSTLYQTSKLDII